MRDNRSKSLDPAGPFRLTNDRSIDPGEVYRWPISSREYRYNGRKGFFQEYIPFDEALIKNKSTDSEAVFTFNGRYDAEVEQSAADSFAETGISRIEVENTGAAAIDAGELVMMLKNDAYDANDAARAEARRGPVEKIARNFIGL